MSEVFRRETEPKKREGGGYSVMKPDPTALNVAYDTLQYYRF